MMLGAAAMLESGQDVCSVDLVTKPSISKGQIQVIFGPMFSGKTTELVRRIQRYKLARQSCVLIKYARDDRYNKDGIATHDRHVTAAVATTKLYDIKADMLPCQVIGIDEGQFFPDVVPFCDEMANQGKTVIVAALDGTFQKKGFGDILNLVPLAESVIKLQAVCMSCYNHASYTKRLGQETEVEVIGGCEKYMAVCRDCHQLSPSKILHKEFVATETPGAKDRQTGNSMCRQLFHT
ncbi:thymidine kinase, cytosolic-like isoform X1 [Branchiostoma lanceolatum]|uniref:thymidine kinase, cytosolic-like isoform X1 n=2 Tax=Branchiostoma lanceolatum TaxID=7740 RepID=UPI0034543CE8